MTLAAGPTFVFDNSFARELAGLYEPWGPEPVPAPRLLALNEALALEIGLDPHDLRSQAGLAVLAGNAVPIDAAPLAQAYSGHQFGNLSPRLGDGRALLLGEVVDAFGRRRDIHLKGSGRTPFARGGDGKAAVGPMLREYVVGEAMHALGIPTTRALAVVATGEDIARETMLPGAVLTRVAASHLRVGTFQFAALTGDRALLTRLVDYAVERHHHEAATADNRALGLLAAVVEAQAALVAQWMLVGFIHGVMNTDNTTISGETIDYGPCAFMDASDPTTVFSSIDHAGRYAYGNQPAIIQWNLSRLAEALLSLIDADVDAGVAAATEVLTTFTDRFSAHWSAGLRAKVGLAGDDSPEAVALGAELIELQREHRLDHTSTFRGLSAILRGVAAPRELDAWVARWRPVVLGDGRDAPAVAAELDRVNPIYIPRNHLVDEALEAATAGDLAPFDELVAVVTDPFVERAGLERNAQPAPDRFSATFRTYCGT